MGVLEELYTDEDEPCAGKPKNWEWTKDALWGVALLSAPAQVAVGCSATKNTAAYPAGLSKF